MQPILLAKLLVTIEAKKRQGLALVVLEKFRSKRHTGRLISLQASHLVQQQLHKELPEE